MLLTELHYAKLWVVCCALRGASWDRMPYEQREIACQLAVRFWDEVSAAG